MRGFQHRQSAPSAVNEPIGAQLDEVAKLVEGQRANQYRVQTWPTGAATLCALSVLPTTRSGHHYSALFSNAATAHRAGRTHDWVVVYEDGRDGEQRAMAVAVRNGPLHGRRTVRGRETECAARYHWPSTA